MAKSIANIDTTVTFQNWFDKTNEMVDIFQSDAMTASPGGDSTTGDCTLIGDFTATNVTATNTIAGDSFASATPGASIDFTSPISVTTGQAVVATFEYGAAGARTRYTDGSLAWDIGMQDSTNGNFIINTGSEDPFKFQLTPAGLLTVPELTCLGTITAEDFVKADGTPIGGSTVENLDDLGDVSAANPSNGQVLKWNGSSWAPAADEVGTATSGIQNLVEDTTPELGGTLILNNQSIAGTGSISYSGTFSTTGNAVIGSSGSNTHTMNGTLTVQGNVHVTGNVRSAHSTSDSRLKTDLQKIEGALDKIDELTGYTFEYSDKPQLGRSTGLIAQEVEKVLPEVVYDYIEDDGKDYKALRYENMMGLLVEAIKELKQDVDDLKNKIR